MSILSSLIETLPDQILSGDITLTGSNREPRVAPEIHNQDHTDGLGVTGIGGANSIRLVIICGAMISVVRYRDDRLARNRLSSRLQRAKTEPPRLYRRETHSISRLPPDEYHQ